MNNQVSDNQQGANMREASASQRRERTRQQRQQRLNAGQKPHSRQARKRRRENNPWFLIGGILVMVVVVVGIFIVLRSQPAIGRDKASADQAFQVLTTLDDAQFKNVATGGIDITKRVKALASNTPIQKGPNGKVQIFYAGADYCPYCGALRWSIIAALSRFGKFSNVDMLISSELKIPTYTFYKSSYSSSYIDFVSLETSDNDGNALEEPTADQQKLIQTYDAPPYVAAESTGGLPFMMYGNKWMSTGSYYQPTDIQNLSYTDIANQLKDSESTTAKNIIGSANYITAMVCSLTDNQPSNVCNADYVQQLQKSLPKSTSFMQEPSNSGQLATLNISSDRDVKRS